MNKFLPKSALASLQKMSLDSARSANSKRSFNTKSSNNDSKSDNSKKGKTHQKTLGMAWGANSRSSSASSFRSSPFSNFGSYMVEKNRKLRNQFDAESSTSGKPIFQGVSIFVDGFTIPSSQELRGYMLKYGGRFENYFSRYRVTHIICSNLPDCKIKNLRSFSAGLPVVKPKWVLDSVAANRLLSWVPYQLDQLASNQPKLSDFFTLKSSSACDDSLKRATCQVKHETDDACSKDTSRDGDSYEGVDSVQHVKIATKENDDYLCEKIDSAAFEKPSSSQGGKCCEGKLAEPSSLEKDASRDGDLYEGGDPVQHLKIATMKHDHTLWERTDSTATEKPSISGCGNFFEEKLADASSFEMGDGMIKKQRLESCIGKPFASVSSYCFDHQSTKGSTSSAAVGPSKQCHSTLGDPNFVENYFKNSRLHFIGAWRNRYRKRFPNSSKGFKGMNYGLNISADVQKTAIIHIDMDCFFVSVVIRNHPELWDKPVAVCHSDNPKGTAEISSANYPAREYGIKAGMFVRDAKALCPQLVIFPYNFEAYEEVADQLYNILHKHCSKVQAVSCDEAFLEVTHFEGKDPEFLASAIRKEIYEATGCTASAGIALNMLMARLATRHAKPDGQYYIPPDRVDEYLLQLPINALPGIGHVLEEKLKRQNVWTCGQLRMISKDSLHKDFGSKTGEMLWNYSRGVDNRVVGVTQESKSVGAEVNWGVRFRDLQDAQRFLLDLCKEVSLRLQGCGVQGRTFTLKMKKRRKDAGEPAKYMGCGVCENLSHTITVPVATDDVEVIQRIAKQLIGMFHFDVTDIRGVGLQVSKLESADTSNKGLQRKSLKSWLKSASETTEESYHINNEAVEKVCKDNEEQSISGNSVHLTDNRFNGDDSSDQTSTLPALCHLDMGVIKSLPEELFSELNGIYGGKLVDLIVESGEQCEKITHASWVFPEEAVKGAQDEADASVLSGSDPLNRVEMEIRENQHEVEEVQAVPVLGAGSCNMAVSRLGLDKTDLMPSSLSQIDTSVLQQLPKELRADILELLPAHRRQELSSTARLGPLVEYLHETLENRTIESQMRISGSGLNNNLWIGNPPSWVKKFKVSNILILNDLADMFYKSRSSHSLSQILQCAIAESVYSLDTRFDGWKEAVDSFCELLKQYIKQKIEVDIEEIYICFRLLRRLATKSEFFLHVYNAVFPYLQASVDENYGGNLHMSPPLNE